MLPSVTVFNLHVDGGAVTFRDESREDVFSESFSPLNISLVDFTTRREKESPYQFQAATGDGLLGEEISWTGNLVVTPLSSRGSFEIKQIRLPRIWEYIKEKVGFEIRNGSVDLAAEYSFSLSDDGPAFTLGRGMLRLTELAVTEKGKEEVLVQVPDYGMEGIAFDLAESALSIDRVHTEGAQVETGLEAGGGFNLARIFTPVETEKAPEPASPETEAAGEGKPFQFRIGQVAMTNNRVMFRDRTLKSPAEIGLEDLSLEPVTPGDLSALAQNRAYSIRGRLEAAGITPSRLFISNSSQGSATKEGAVQAMLT